MVLDWDVSKGIENGFLFRCKRIEIRPNALVSTEQNPVGHGYTWVFALVSLPK
ncbi:hypothetical protein [Flavobacterium orientale]|uniref:hypothetical protein n=1 Tax=Flavobacterium orientale TaxID=1756020 RepID=UPI00166B440F|nr:hypothetical protein [Flavobacterium orientale]